MYAPGTPEAIDDTRADGIPVDVAIQLPQLRARYALLVCLNRRLRRLLPLVDTTLRRARGVVTTDPSALHFPSALGRRVAALRGLIFTRTKLSFWSAVLKATVEYTQPAQVRGSWRAARQSTGIACTHPQHGHLDPSHCCTVACDSCRTCTIAPRGSLRSRSSA